MRRKFVFALVAALAVATSARAAEISVFATGALAEPLKALSTEYGKKNGDTFKFTLGTTKIVMDNLAAGGMPDIIMISEDAADTLEKQEKFAPLTRVPVARSLFGAAVRDGAPVPDISTVEAFKKTVLAAKSISYPDPKGGAVTGLYIEKLFAQLGIAEATKKAHPYRLGADVAQALAKGDVELGLSFISEFAPVKGVKLVGPFPDAIQSPQLYVAAVASASAQKDAARAFIAYVTTKEAGKKLKAMGLDPVAK